MQLLTNIVLIVQILSAVAMIGLVLIQHGKGADMGAAFGSGSAGSLFGSAGAANFLSRSTAVLAAVFFASSLALTYFSAPSKGGVVTEGLAAPAAAGKGDFPAAPASSAPAPAQPQQKDSPAKSTEIPK